MKKNRLTRSKAVCIIAAALLVAAALCIPELPAYAAGTINVKLSDNVSELGDDFEGFDFDLYKVGGYEGAGFKLDPDYDDVNVSIPSQAEYEAGMQEGDPTWQQAWLDSANTLANHITHPAEGQEAPEPVATFSDIKQGDTMTYNADENALYLLVGNTVRYNNQYFTPLPMFVRTLDGTENYLLDGSIKMDIRPVVLEHSLLKVWEDGENEVGVRPENIEVGIYYGSMLIDTITLGKTEDGKYVWNYSWKSEEIAGQDFVYITQDADGNEVRRPFTPSADDAGWAVKEIMSEDEARSDEAKAEVSKLRYYETSYQHNGDDSQESFIITNKMTHKKLKIVKTIDGYDDEGHNVTFSFKIIGKNAAGEVVYTNHAGVTFTKQDGLTKETVIEYIPADVETIEVFEEYTGNYKQVGETVYKDLTEDVDGVTVKVGWEADIENEHDGHGPNGGVVNRYKPGSEPAQDPGQAPGQAAADTQE